MLSCELPTPVAEGLLHREGDHRVGYHLGTRTGRESIHREGEYPLSCLPQGPGDRRPSGVLEPCPPSSGSDWLAAGGAGPRASGIRTRLDLSFGASWTAHRGLFQCGAAVSRRLAVHLWPTRTGGSRDGPLSRLAGQPLALSHCGVGASPHLVVLWGPSWVGQVCSQGQRQFHSQGLLFAGGWELGERWMCRGKHWDKLSGTFAGSLYGFSLRAHIQRSIR